MLKEFEDNPVYKGDKLLKNVWNMTFEEGKRRLSHFSDGVAPVDKWMMFPKHGYLLADTYKRPVVLLSKEASSTFLPLTAPLNTLSPICISLLSDRSHFIAFQPKGDLWPAPPIDAFWRFYSTDPAKGWKNWIKANSDLWQGAFKRKSKRTQPVIIDID